MSFHVTIVDAELYFFVICCQIISYSFLSGWLLKVYSLYRAKHLYPGLVNFNLQLQYLDATNCHFGTSWPKVLANFEQRNHYTNVAKTFGQVVTNLSRCVIITILAMGSRVIWKCHSSGIPIMLQFWQRDPWNFLILGNVFETTSK